MPEHSVPYTFVSFERAEEMKSSAEGAGSA